MKVRLSYVSNSSSSSFCVMGVVFDYANDIDTYDAFDEYIDAKTPLVREDGIDEYYKRFVIGIPAEDMSEDETLKQFKSRVYKELKKFSKKTKAELGISEEDIRWRIDGGMK